MEEKTFLTFEASKSLDQRARLAAAVLGVSRSEIFRRSTEAFLANMDLPKINASTIFQSKETSREYA